MAQPIVEIISHSESPQHYSNVVKIPMVGYSFRSWWWPGLVVARRSRST